MDHPKMESYKRYTSHNEYENFTWLPYIVPCVDFEG